jgi:CRISPR system Cascade subunit CasB
LLDGVEEWDQWRFFLVAGLVAIDPADHCEDRETHGEDGETSSLAEALHKLAESHSSAIELRFMRLLDADRDDLPFLLRQAAHLLAGAGVHWDAAQLLADLRWWGHPRRHVQRRWARTFWTGTGQSGSPTSGDVPTDRPQPTQEVTT